MSLLLFAILGGGAAGRGAALPWDIVFTEVPFVRAAKAKQGGYLEGSRLIRLGRDGSLCNLTPGFHSAADPSVSFDGKRILFAGKRGASDNWDVHEMNADGGEVRRITHDLGDCRTPIYQSSIFYLDDPGPMPQIGFVRSETAALYSARMDGSGVRRLTYNLLGASDPAMLPDGRMLYSGWVGNRLELMGVNIDGTDYATFSGGQGRRVKRMACVTAGRKVVFVEADTAQWDGAGALAALDLRRNLHSYRRLAAAGPGLFHSPSPLPDGGVLVSRRPVTGAGTHGIYRLDPERGTLSLVLDRPESHEIQAQALAPREVPDGRSSVVDEKVEWAKLYCLNLYESDLDARSWPKGLVKRLRIVEAAGKRERRFIGEIDVDEDGSFNVQIPANTPVQLQALDAGGMALRASEWIWAKNKEHRGCIGCHEDGERTPENVMASALRRPSANFVLPPERRRTVEYRRDIAPFLRRKCATSGCHGETDLLRQVTPGQARTSPLIWAVEGRNTSRPWDRVAPGKPPRKMPPAGSAALTDAERRALIEWIDLGGRP
jgi:hypothetical protein